MTIPHLIIAHQRLVQRHRRLDPLNDQLAKRSLEPFKGAFSIIVPDDELS
jgi:hypothetical protein